MKILVPFALALSLALPSHAQKMGMSNNNAPTIDQSIKLGDQTLSVTYTAITWASGKTMEAAMSKDGGPVRQRINGTAERAPLGSLKASSAFSFGGKNVAAGEYKLYFTIDDELKWHLVLAGTEKLDWALDLKDAGQASNRLHLGMMAGEHDGTGALMVAFGTKHCVIDFKPGEAK